MAMPNWRDELKEFEAEMKEHPQQEAPLPPPESGPVAEAASTPEPEAAERKQTPKPGPAEAKAATAASPKGKSAPKKAPTTKKAATKKSK